MNGRISESIKESSQAVKALTFLVSAAVALVWSSAKACKLFAIMLFMSPLHMKCYSNALYNIQQVLVHICTKKKEGKSVCMYMFASKPIYQLYHIVLMIANTAAILLQIHFFPYLTLPYYLVCTYVCLLSDSQNKKKKHIFFYYMYFAFQALQAI